MKYFCFYKVYITTQHRLYFKGARTRLKSYLKFKAFDHLHDGLRSIRLSY